MNITLEKNGVTALITVAVEKADYQDSVKKELKHIATQAEMPGFRKGKVPFALVQKRFGLQVKMDEINKLLGTKLMEYIRENNVNVLGEPMPAEQEPIDIESEDTMNFKFDLALAPEFECKLAAEDTVDYYDIVVTDEQVEEQIKMFAQQAGHPENVEEYADRDIVRGALAEQDAEGNILEGGIAVEKASLMPAYFKGEAQKALFEGAKVGDVMTINPYEAYEGNSNEIAALMKIEKEEVENHKGSFTFQIEEISRFMPAEMNQEFFDRVFEEGEVTSEEQFRSKVRELMGTQHEADSDYKLLLDIRKYCEEKVGALEFPTELLKRFMLEQNREKENAEEYVEKNFDKSIEELRWHLIKEQLVAANEVKIAQEDVKEQALKATRFQFMQYGMNNIPEEYVERYAEDMMKNQQQVQGLVERAIDEKLTAALKNVITLRHQSVSVEDFQKLFQE